MQKKLPLQSQVADVAHAFLIHFRGALLHRSVSSSLPVPLFLAFLSALLSLALLRCTSPRHSRQRATLRGDSEITAIDRPAQPKLHQKSGISTPESCKGVGGKASWARRTCSNHAHTARQTPAASCLHRRPSEPSWSPWDEAWTTGV